jgi:hypothetical protein
VTGRPTANVPLRANDRQPHPQITTGVELRRTGQTLNEILDHVA